MGLFDIFKKKNNTVAESSIEQQNNLGDASGENLSAEISGTKELTIELNARLQPMHRVEMFEDPLEKVLLQANAGELIGGGTLQATTGEIEKCDLTIKVNDDWIEKILAYLQGIRLIPKGSKIFYNQEIFPIGQAEGLALYLNGTDLPSEVYQSNDVNKLISELQGTLGEKCFMFSWWEGGTETALYFYGENYLVMHESIKNILDVHPLCKLSRIKQIA